MQNYFLIDARPAGDTHTATIYRVAAGKRAAADIAFLQNFCKAHPANIFFGKQDTQNLNFVSNLMCENHNRDFYAISANLARKIMQNKATANAANAKNLSARYRYNEKLWNEKQPPLCPKPFNTITL